MSISHQFKLLLLFLGAAARTRATHHDHSNGPLIADESFRRLQSGENSDEMVNQCCKREQHFLTIGYGVDDTQMRVDVGECRQMCNKQQPKLLKREDFDKYLKKYPNLDPVQIFLALQSRVSPQDGNSSTSSSSTSSVEEELFEGDTSSLSTSLTSSSSSSCVSSICLPISTRKERHFGPGGQHYQVDVIERCDCVKVPDTCQKVARPVRLHVDTPFETVVDMGACLGPCGESETTCRSVRNRTVSVEGPNGAQCLQVIEECECTGKCYRIKEHLKVFDFGDVFASTHHNQSEGGTSPSHRDPLNDNLISGGESNPHTHPPPTPPTQPLTKVIDIGRCGGSCSSTTQNVATSKCLLWSPAGNCVSRLYGGQPTCTPTKFMTHSYTDKKGHKHSLYSIVSCGCH